MDQDPFLSRPSLLTKSPEGGELQLQLLKKKRLFPKTNLSESRKKRSGDEVAVFWLSVKYDK